MYRDISNYLKDLQLGNIEFVGCGRTKKGTEWVKKRHSHDFLELLYFLGGEVNIDVPGKVLHLSPYDMIVYPPGVPHLEMPDAKSMQEIISLAVRVNGHSPISSSFKVVDFDGVFRWLFEQLYKENSEKKEFYGEIMKNHFKSMIFHMVRYFEKNTNGEQDILSIVLHFIHDNYPTHIDMKKLASLCHVSESYLSRLFAKELGVRPITYLNLLRIETAKKMLAAGKMSIREIAQNVGFEDQLYFSRAFKKVVKVTPSGFRNQEKSSVLSI